MAWQRHHPAVEGDYTLNLPTSFRLVAANMSPYLPLTTATPQDRTFSFEQSNVNTITYHNFGNIFVSFSYIGY